jgi:phage tail-like protein
MARSPTLWYALELDGDPVGRLSSFSGGDATADVVVEKVGADAIAHKHLADVRYEDICLTCGADMAPTFYDWLQQTLDSNVSRKNGAIVAYDYSGKEASRLNFFNALVSEVGFPALDVGLNDAAKLTIKLSPEYTREDTTGKSTARGMSSKPTRWVVSNFRLTIDGKPYPHVAQIEAIALSLAITSNPVGTVRDYAREPAYLIVPDLVITSADVANDTATAALRNWFYSFVVQGSNGQDQEKSGKLEYLTSDLKTVLFTLDLRQLGVYRLVRPNDESPDAIPKFRAALYCEQMQFSYGDSSAVTVGTSSTSSVPSGGPSLGVLSQQPGGATLVAAGPGTTVGQGVRPSASGQPRVAVLTNPPPALRILTPANGPRNLLPLQDRPIVPSPQPNTSLVFRRLEAGPDLVS